jgi:hypothetical protein
MVNMIKLMDILNELVTDTEVICSGPSCKHKWKIVDGGKDPYLCHKCGYDNTPEQLEEKKKKKDRCARIADRKYDKPSAYKSGAIVRCRKGNIWKGLKEEIDQLDEKKKETLRTWFKRKGAPGKTGGWVDCNTCREVDGKKKCKPCGRKKGETRAKYPSCRPTPSQCSDSGKGKKWGKTK